VLQNSVVASDEALAALIVGLLASWECRSSLALESCVNLQRSAYGLGKIQTSTARQALCSGSDHFRNVRCFRSLAAQKCWRGSWPWPAAGPSTLSFPVAGGYVTVSQLVSEGVAIGNILVGGTTFHVAVIDGPWAPESAK
jgi:hypothetical protein